MTQIEANAFASCKAVELLFPSNITNIGETNVCYGCPNLVSVVIESPTLRMGQSTFRACPALQSVTLLATTPPTFEFSNDMTFLGAPNAKIYVPASAVDTYKSAAVWSNYASRIYAIPE